MGADHGMFDDGVDPVVVAYVVPSSFMLNVVTLSVRIFSMWQAS